MFLCFVLSLLPKCETLLVSITRRTNRAQGPPTIVPPEMFKEMERAAQRLTQNIGYRGAGTVEYLFNPESNSFFFLELNPRLQVRIVVAVPDFFVCFFLLSLSDVVLSTLGVGFVG